MNVGTLIQREGIWTRVELRPTCVVVFRDRTYVRGAVLGASLTTAVGSILAYGLLQQERSVAAVVASLVALGICGSLWFRTVSSLKRLRVPILVVADGPADQELWPHDVVVHAGDVKALEIRENCGRDADDMALWQTYLHVRGSDVPILIHQRPKYGPLPDKTLARALATRWDIPIQENHERGRKLSPSPPTT